MRADKDVITRAVRHAKPGRYLITHAPDPRAAHTQRRIYAAVLRQAQLTKLAGIGIKRPASDRDGWGVYLIKYQRQEGKAR